ncbi:MAG: Lrp/AsnC family transcriptional regulator [Proteobacteria bacterium]|nr:Lrp/AsnC family transcriptional regulator [Pseudomonadota bacterium]
MDKMGRAILAHLARDARITWQELGRQVHLTGQAVAVRVQQMMDNGTIRRFTVVRGDLRNYFITVFMDTSRFDEFESFLQAREEVERASKVAGEGCYHLVLACEDDAALEIFTRDLLRYGRYKVSSEMRRVKG